MKLFTQIITKVFTSALYVQHNEPGESSTVPDVFNEQYEKKKKKHHLGATTSFSTFPHHCTLHYTDDTFVMITESGLVGQSKMNSSA